MNNLIPPEDQMHFGVSTRLKIPLHLERGSKLIDYIIMGLNAKHTMLIFVSKKEPFMGNLLILES